MNKRFTLKHKIITAAALILPYGVSVAAVVTAERGSSLAPKFIAFVVIAIAQNYLQSLQHEAAHFHLARKRETNDLLADIFCAMPFFTLIKHYRSFHFDHHRYLGSDRDPERKFYAEQGYDFTPKSGAKLLSMMMRDISGFHYLEFLYSFCVYTWSAIKSRDLTPWSNRDLGCAVAFWAPVIVVALYYGRLDSIFWYWILPQMTLTFFMLKLQGYGEHKISSLSSVEATTRRLVLSMPIRYLLYPLNADFHLEHHLNSQFFWYELPRTRKEDTELKSYGYFYGEFSVFSDLLVKRSRNRLGVVSKD